MAKTYIHVNQHKIRSSVVRYGGNDKPLLSCGARVVIETEAEVEIIR